MSNEHDSSYIVVCCSSVSSTCDDADGLHVSLEKNKIAILDVLLQTSTGQHHGSQSRPYNCFYPKSDRNESKLGSMYKLGEYTNHGCG